jgi:hypothetical protein
LQHAPCQNHPTDSLPQGYAWSDGFQAENSAAHSAVVSKNTPWRFRHGVSHSTDYDVGTLLRLVEVVDGLFDAAQLNDAEGPEQDDE